MAVTQHPLPCPAFFTALVADTKPTTWNGGQTIPNGAVLYTTDTPAWFIWSTNQWVASNQFEA